MSRGMWQRVVTIALGTLAGGVAAAGTLAVATAGFTLSYDAIRKVGIASGVRPDWSWLLPVSIDGAMAVATVTAVVMRRMGRKAGYPWAVVLAGSGISIACNAVHATMRDHIQLGDRTAMAVSAIPAVMLALSVHLLVVLVDAAARTLTPGPVEEVATPLATVVATPPPASPVATEVATVPSDSAGTSLPTESEAKLPPSAVKLAKLRARRPATTQPEAAGRLELSERTVQRYWSSTTPPASQPDAAPVNGRVPDLEGASS